MRIARLIVAPFALVWWVGCGGPPRPSLPVAPLPPITTPPPVAAPTFDLSPVTMPPSVVLIARVARPSKIPGVVAAWTGLPIPVEEPLNEVLGRRVSPLVDLTKPLDLAVSIPAASSGKRSKPAYAVSAALRSLDDAKTALASDYTLTPLANGAVRAEPRKSKCKDDDDCEEDYRARACALAPAFGAASARVVCGEGSSDALWPYMVRGATRLDWSADVHVEIYGDGVRAAVAESGPLRWIARDIGRAGTLGADFADFTGDIDKLVFEGKAEDAALGLNGTIAFKQVRSPLTRVAIAHADKAGPPPAAFLKLPAESDAALFDSGIDAAEMEHGKTVLGELLDKSLEEDAMPFAERTAAVNASKSLFALTEAPIVWAKGVDLAAANAAVGLAQSTSVGPQRAAAQKTALAKLGGWNVLGVELPIAKVGAVAKEWVRLFARPGLGTWRKARNLETPMPTFKPAPVPKGLPADTQRYEMVVSSIDWSASNAVPRPAMPPGKPPPPPPPPVIIAQKIQLYLVPDGGRTWAVWSLDEAIAEGRAKAMLGAGPTLATKPGLDELRAARSNAGGFVTMRAIALDSPLSLASRVPRWILERPDPLYGMASSNAGAQPVPFWFAGGPSNTTVAGARVSQAAIRDGMVLSRALRW